MKLNKFIKITLLIYILAEEIKRVRKGQNVSVNFKITNLNEFKEILETTVRENDISLLDGFKPTLNQD